MIALFILLDIIILGIAGLILCLMIIGVISLVKLLSSLSNSRSHYPVIEAESGQRRADYDQDVLNETIENKIAQAPLPQENYASARLRRASSEDRKMVIDTDAKAVKNYSSTILDYYGGDCGCYVPGENDGRGGLDGERLINNSVRDNDFVMQQEMIRQSGGFGNPSGNGFNNF